VLTTQDNFANLEHKRHARESKRGTALRNGTSTARRSQERNLSAESISMRHRGRLSNTSTLDRQKT